MKMKTAKERQKTDILFIERYKKMRSNYSVKRSGARKNLSVIESYTMDTLLRLVQDVI